MRECMHCSKELHKRSQKKFCSNICHANYRYGFYINLWKRGKVSGNKGISAKNISGHLRRYLIEKYGEKCCLCGWKMKNPVTNSVPLEIDHIDGNSENNKDSNLKLLCPNCHSLTPYFKNLNRGKGRKWRMNKYIKNS